MTEQQEARYSHFVTVRLERAVRDRLQARQAELQVETARYLSLSDAVDWLCDLADRTEAKAGD